MEKNPEEKTVLADRLKLVLESREMKSYDLAKILEVSSSRVSDWLRAKAKPSSKNLLLISEKLGVDVNWLLHGKGEMYARPFQSEIDAVEETFRMQLPVADFSRAQSPIEFGMEMGELQFHMNKLRELLGRCLVRNKSGVISISSKDQREIVDTLCDVISLFTDDDLIVLRRVIEREQRRRSSPPNDPPINRAK